jgi:hypothetical protein
MKCEKCGKKLHGEYDVCLCTSCRDKLLMDRENRRRNLAWVASRAK